MVVKFLEFSKIDYKENFICLKNIYNFFNIKNCLKKSTKFHWQRKKTFRIYNFQIY